VGLVKRPVGVTILTVYWILSGAASFGQGLRMIWDVVLAGDALPGERSWWGLVLLLVNVFPCVMGVFGLAIGLGLWKLRRWARRLVIVLSGLGVGSVALTFVLRQVTDRWVPPLWLWLPMAAFYFLCLIYMFSHDAKQAFST